MVGRRARKRTRIASLVRDLWSREAEPNCRRLGFSVGWSVLVLAQAEGVVKPLCRTRDRSKSAAGWHVSRVTPALPRRAKVGGPDRDRTGDLMNAIHARSQLRYWPTGERSNSELYLRRPAGPQRNGAQRSASSIAIASLVIVSEDKKTVYVPTLPLVCAISEARAHFARHSMTLSERSTPSCTGRRMYEIMAGYPGSRRRRNCPPSRHN